MSLIGTAIVCTIPVAIIAAYYRLKDSNNTKEDRRILWGFLLYPIVAYLFFVNKDNIDNDLRSILAVIVSLAAPVWIMIGWGVIFNWDDRKKKNTN